jgi:hypothetical protein
MRTLELAALAAPDISPVIHHWTLYREEYSSRSDD